MDEVRLDVFGERAGHGEVGRRGVGIVRYGATMTGAGKMAVQGMYVMVCQSRVLRFANFYLLFEWMSRWSYRGTTYCLIHPFWSVNFGVCGFGRPALRQPDCQYITLY